MIITIADLRRHVDCGYTTDEQITVRLESIEAVIRKYTQNNFQQRGIRFAGHSTGNKVYGEPKNFRVGDTVQISNSQVNDGLYCITKVGADFIELDKPIFDTEDNLVTKISYPADVVQCAVDLYRWKQNMGGKVGIKSETISRHSVTYEDSGTLFMGYPVGILNGLILHKKARC